MTDSWMFTVVLRRRDRRGILTRVMVHRKAISCAAIRADKFISILWIKFVVKIFRGVKTSFNPLACYRCEWTMSLLVESRLLFVLFKL